MIEISSEMFEQIEHRCRRLAEIQFQQVMFDTPPENAAQIHDAMIERFTAMNWKRVGATIAAAATEAAS